MQSIVPALMNPARRYFASVFKSINRIQHVSASVHVSSPLCHLDNKQYTHHDPPFPALHQPILETTQRERRGCRQPNTLARRTDKQDRTYFPLPFSSQESTWTGSQNRPSDPLRNAFFVSAEPLAFKCPHPSSFPRWRDNTGECSISRAGAG